LQLFVLILAALIVGSISAVFFTYLLHSAKDSFFGVTSGFAYYILRSHDISGAISRKTLPKVEKKIAANLELQEEILYVALINNQGEVLLDTTGGDVKKIYLNDKKNKWMLKEEKESFFFLRQLPLREKHFDVANVVLPIYFQGEVWGVGVVGVAADYLFKYALPRAAIFVAILFVVFLSLSAAASIALMRFLFKPVRELIQGTERIFEQDFETEIPAYGDDEIGELAETFNRLMSYLKDFISRLQGQALLDPMTNCYREDFFNKQLGIELERSERFRDSLCAGWIMIYSFSEVEDKYGKIIGEQLIKTFADILKKSTRHIDVLAYSENGNFGLILPKTDSEGALVVIERILSAIQRISYEDETGRTVGHLGVNYSLVSYAIEEDISRPSSQDFLNQSRMKLDGVREQGPNRGSITKYKPS
ncbi:diguanylate cyclase, partial [bacterium]|nr:diguanylate cyclase [bacterium]